MAPLRPIGHIACNLQILAIGVCYRLRQSIDGMHYACWVDDDGCVYLALTHHPRAGSMQRHAPEQVVNTYGKPKGQPFPLTHADVLSDLHEARLAHASRHIRMAHAEAAAA